MKIAYKYMVTVISAVLASWWLCPGSCPGAEQSTASVADQLQVLRAEDGGLHPLEQPSSFASSIFAEASQAGLIVLSNTKVSSRTNGLFSELRQNLNVEATEAQLEDFLGNLAATNSPLRVQSLSLRPTPDRSRLRVSVAIAGDYRLPTSGHAGEPDAAQTEYRLLSERRHLRQAALDCYQMTKSMLPPGWQLESLSFQEGKRLSAQGMAPADQVSMLQDVRTKIEQAKTADGKELFVPGSSQATMRMAPGSTNFSWSMQFDLKRPEG